MEGVIKMILFTILLTLVVAIAVIGLIAAFVAGWSLIMILGDLIVFGLIVWLIIKIFGQNKE